MKQARRRVRFEVLPDRDGGWSLTRDRVVTGTFHTKAAAVDYAATEGRKVLAAGKLAQLFIKGRNGRIQDERTYGRDPRDIPG